MAKVEKRAAFGWSNCLVLTDGPLCLWITIDVGPRIVGLTWRGGQDLFYQHKADLGVSGGSDWRIYGGHRLWVAPEDVQRTYAPDNCQVSWDWDGETLELRAATDAAGLDKIMRIEVDGALGAVRVNHQVINKGARPQSFAVWALTAMGPGGRAIVPAEPRTPHPEGLLPARPLVLWPYTDMTDARWRWGRDLFELQQDPAVSSPQKVGLHCGPGWVAWARPGVPGDSGRSADSTVFLKTWDGTSPPADQPDMGANLEIFTDGNMLELETLGPYKAVAPGEMAQHTEQWKVTEIHLATEESALLRQLQDLVL